MPCYNPIYALKSDRYSKHGKKQVNIIGPLKFARVDPKEVPLSENELLLPCGHCIGCRLDYSRKWADRMMLELDHSKKGIFVTLTYNNKHVPMTEISYNGELCEFGALTLDKRDLQLFFKRLRKKFKDKEIRYYAAGEYGSNTERPHYHAIIFGLSLEDLKNLKFYKLNKLKQPIYISPELNEVWSIRKKRFFDDEEEFYDPIGFVTVAAVTWETCAYVSRYVQKKVFGGKNYLQDLYECESEFSVMSRRPGIGNYFPLDHPEVFDYTILRVDDCSKEIPLPSHYVDMLVNGSLGYSSENTLKWLVLTKNRKEYCSDKLLTKLGSSDLGLIECYEQEENEKLQKSATLERKTL